MKEINDTIILQCPRCGHIKHWVRISDAEGPGYCLCKSYQYWKVLKEKPKYKKGYVIVMSDKGYQELRGPYYREDPNGWKKSERR